MLVIKVHNNFESLVNRGYKTIGWAKNLKEHYFNDLHKPTKFIKFPLFGYWRS